MYQNLSELKKAGFTGFRTVAELWKDHSSIPNEKGIYVVINPDCSKKKFLERGVGGFFKAEDPNVSLDRLENEWVVNCSIIYIGQAGGNGSKSNLKKRLKQYLDFGNGKPVGHRGGRFIWQLQHHPDLIFAWKTNINVDPILEETRLISEFKSHYGKRPFANLRD